MAITASARRLLAQYSPQFEAATLAETQTAVDAAPETYEGKYIVALDQPDGQQLFYVEAGQVIPAYEQGGIKAEEAVPPPREVKVFDGATEVSDLITVQWLTGITDGTGKVTVHATDTGASGGSA